MWVDWPRRALIGLVKGYRLLLSPWLGSSCRFEPTCSVYAIGALSATAPWPAPTSCCTASAAAALVRGRA
jgi:putative membrane protein insertion efficiency factor